jgi:hypothetical protein
LLCPHKILFLSYLKQEIAIPQGQPPRRVCAPNRAASGSALPPSKIQVAIYGKGMEKRRK